MSASPIECPKYEPMTESRRCRYFVDNGGCALPSEFMCREWLRVNAQLACASTPMLSKAGLSTAEPGEVRHAAPRQAGGRCAGASGERQSRETSSKPDAPTRSPRLSYSRIDRWAQCRLSYRFRYIDRVESTEPRDAAELGSAAHQAIEAIEREHVRNETRGPISREAAKAHWRRAFTERGLAGADVFQEGLDMVLGFVRDQGELDPYDILAIEEPFEIAVGQHTVIGVIDRADRVDDETIEIIDFKSSRLLFTRDELDTNLQLSLYALAARNLWPWARRVRLTMWMLRHGVRQETTRTAEQLEAAREYVQAVGDAIASATEYPARPNTLCGYCEFRRQCPAYAELLKGGRELAAESLDDLEQVAREREQVAAVSKASYRRQKELDDLLKARLAECDELVLAGVRYTTFKITSPSYPLEPTVEVLSRASGMDAEVVRSRIAAVDNTKLKRLLTKVAKERGRAQAALVEAELGALAKERHTQRLWAKPIKEVRT